MPEYRTMADKFREDFFGLPPKPSTRAPYKTLADKFDEDFNDLPPRQADPRYKTLAEKMAEELWAARHRARHDG
ncbi:hypothetical protein SAMN05660642_03056 [Geodermatophilus siccatus]|uniref:Uncharacterized protein n=1 Tax=Geodermatophilus siccatus TaxID=1137991 RepID=A0A1G9V249_9ACTN|nr:hypothetical protein [Geodermatophilus siccatus]SDM66302.1 hypothetical protein SAMN05660642_03056 [Geodermatophilus siccatus]